MIENIKVTTEARNRLYRQYASKLVVNEALDRKLVSFQANRQIPFYSWFKYREGFSVDFIDYILATLNTEAGVILDPFAGAGASIFRSASAGWQAVGIEVLPVGTYAMSARKAEDKTNIAEFRNKAKEILSEDFASNYDENFAFAHIPITQGAFPEDTEREMAGYLSLCNERCEDSRLRTLFTFACFCILESISYTRKDGQYLRWDHRSGRRGRVKKPFYKSEILSFRQAITVKLDQIAADLQGTPQNGQSSLFAGSEASPVAYKEPKIIEGSSLEVLPSYPANSVDLVVTSPPYCNRYDYTRTYALELAFLGYGDEQVKKLRQIMLSCTVENKDKFDYLRSVYADADKLTPFEQIHSTFLEQDALHEVLHILEQHKQAGTLNNSNVPKMVRNYFYEMCFIIYELARVLRDGGRVVMVNDNVRYVGEEVPVDLILSNFAEAFGLSLKTIWVLPKGKGNSSQQMGAYGRSEIRKCVYVWEKNCA